MQQTYTLRLACICCSSSWSTSSGSNKVWCLTNLFSAFRYHHLIPRPVLCWHFSPWSLHPSHVLPIWREARAAGGLRGLAGVCSWLVESRYHWPMVGGCTEVLFARRGHWISAHCSVSWNLGIEQEFNFFETLYYQIWLKLANKCKIIWMIIQTLSRWETRLERFWALGVGVFFFVRIYSEQLKGSVTRYCKCG